MTLIDRISRRRAIRFFLGAGRSERGEGAIMLGVTMGGGGDVMVISKESAMVPFARSP